MRARASRARTRDADDVAGGDAPEHEAPAMVRYEIVAFIREDDARNCGHVTIQDVSRT